MARVRLAVAAIGVSLIAGACSIGAPAAFVVTGASIDSAHTCPFGAIDVPYDLHGTIDVRNGTSGTVTIQSVTALMTLAAVKGAWLEPVGTVYDPGTVTVAPTSLAAGATGTLKLTMHSSCSNGKAPSTVTSYADYSVALTVATSGGTFKIVSRHRHRIIPA